MANILVIDDDTSLLQMIGIMLKRAGHTAVLADSGQEGITIAQRDLPEMVIVDVMMPGITGYDVCKTLRKEAATRNIPLLMLTALSQAEHRGRAEDAGADGFVTKPATRDDLIKHVEELIKTGARNFPNFTDTLPAIPGEAPAQPAKPVAAAVNAMGTVTDIFKTPDTPAPPAPVTTPAPVGTSTGTYPVIVTRLPLVAVIGLTGGAGTTTLAINLGLALMQFGRTCIIDLNNRLGQVAAQLNLTPHNTWLNLLDFKPGADKRLVGQALTVDHPSGMAVVAAPSVPVMERLKGSALFYTFSVLAEGFSRVVVDLPHDLDSTSASTLTTADHIVLVIGNDPAKLLRVPEALKAIDALRLPGQIHLVLNHHQDTGVAYERVMSEVNQPLASDVPYEPGQTLALKSGKPLVMSQPGSLFSRALLQLARQM
jgi:CheY-like chemotaxis protein/MinD-like ATPase involved in chromosome partitioning or flagellar assembly